MKRLKITKGLAGIFLPSAWLLLPRRLENISTGLLENISTGLGKRFQSLRKHFNTSEALKLAGARVFAHRDRVFRPGVYCVGTTVVPLLGLLIKYVPPMLKPWNRRMSRSTELRKRPVLASSVGGT